MMSAIDVTAKTLFERLYLVLGMGTFGPWVNCPYAPTTLTVHSTTISRFLSNFSPRMASYFFGHHDSPSNLYPPPTPPGGRLKKSKKIPARAGWPRRLALVRATSRAEVDVIGAHLCSCARAIFPWVALYWSARSISLIFVDNSPSMHNTDFFPDSYLLSVTNGSIWIPYLARYSEIFKKPNFQVVN